jgi:hypothetical protein
MWQVQDSQQQEEEAEGAEGAEEEEQQQEEQEEEEEVYCVCQGAKDPTRDFIGCDSCNGWFHPECVGTTMDAVDAMVRPSPHHPPPCQHGMRTGPRHRVPLPHLPHALLAPISRLNRSAAASWLGVHRWMGACRITPQLPSAAHRLATM